MGKIKFGLHGLPQFNEKIWYYMDNQVDYKNYLQYLPTIFYDLNLIFNTVTRMEIALDSYYVFYGEFIRKCLRNKDNKVKLLGKYIDRETVVSRITYWNYGSLDNPSKVKTIYIKNKRKTNNSKNKKSDSDGKENKTTIEMIGYDKLEEIQNFTPYKTYIIDYHKEHNPKLKHIYREEIRLESEELRRLAKKRGKSITIENLLSKEFLYEVFTEYIDRIIVIKDSKGKKIDLFPKPFLGSCEGIIPHTPASGRDAMQPIKNEKNTILEDEQSLFDEQEKIPPVESNHITSEESDEFNFISEIEDTRSIKIIYIPNENSKPIEEIVKTSKEDSNLLRYLLNPSSITIKKKIPKIEKTKNTSVGESNGNNISNKKEKVISSETNNKLNKKTAVIIEPTEKEVNSTVVCMLRVLKKNGEEYIGKRRMIRMWKPLIKEDRSNVKIIDNALKKCHDDGWINFFYNEFNCSVNLKKLSKITFDDLIIFDYNIIKSFVIT